MHKNQIKNLQKPAKKSAKSKNGRFLFRLPPSKIPTKISKLQSLNRELMSYFQQKSTYSITERSIYPLYSSLYNTIYSNNLATVDSDKVDSTDIANVDWLNIIEFIYYVYHMKSVNCYVNIRDINRFEYDTKESYNLFKMLKSYYTEILDIKTVNMHYNTMLRTCVWFILHLERAYKNNSLGIKISLSRKFYVDYQKETKADEKISGAVVKNIVSMLDHYKFVDVYKGYNNKFKNGDDSERANSMLLLYPEVFTLIDKDNIKNKTASIQIKRDNKNLVSIKSPKKNKGGNMVEFNLDTIKYAEKILRDYNDLLSECKVAIGEYEIPELFFRRIFIGDTEHYGRIHDSEFQTTPKRYRKNVLIDGKETVTIDINHIHPSLLYLKEGIKLDSDFSPYPIIDIPVNKKDIKRFMKFYDLKEYNPVRNFTKLCLLVLINANSYAGAKMALKKKLKEDFSKGLTFKEQTCKFIGLEDIDVSYVMNKVMEHNAPIKDYFLSGISTELMNLDSNIIIKAIEYLTKRNIVCLPIHDSLTVAKENKHLAIKALEEGFLSTMNTLDNFSVDEE